MKKILVSVILAVAFVLAACTPAAPTDAPATSAPTEVPSTATAEPAADTTSIPEITIDAVDFSYTAPESIGAGWVRVKLTNSGKEPHHIEFLRLNDGVTFEQFQEAMKKGPGSEMTVSKLMGGEIGRASCRERV